MRAVLALIILSWTCVPSFAYSAKVLIIESYHAQYEWDESYLYGIRQEVGERAQIATFEMNTKRVPKEQYAAMAEKAFAKYQAMKPDVVVLGDDNALSYLYPYLYDEPISMVFLGINSNPRKLFADYPGQAKVTGVLELPLFVKNVGEIKRILGRSPLKIWVLFDSGVTSAIAGEYIESQYQMIKKSLEVEVAIYFVDTQAHWQEMVRRAKEESVDAILVGLYHTLVDEEGNSVPSDEILFWTNQYSEVPLFGFWDFSVGKGKTAGGVVLFGEVQGRHVGRIINQLIDGKSADAIPIQIGNQGRPLYSDSEMRRWNLLPPKGWEGIE
ncbi:hypothetical protein MOV00_000798 [Vibrio vulnificus]|nr:hypothetical protein [Vibrio vulnificus]EIZ1170710.1 hypothetical protein [Vibrio vulnificus]EKG2458427.1 hypothetical protein [Vibrio vulnificus]ELG4785049.1 hypothetical protein [Vibrio vulnificus]HAS6306097.1 hypothetical protein [Vibrio vulnificus]